MARNNPLPFAGLLTSLTNQTNTTVLAWAGHLTAFDDGQNLTLVPSGLTRLYARTLQAGPVATIRLQHHVPLSFHGFWDAADCGNRQP